MKLEPWPKEWAARAEALYSRRGRLGRRQLLYGIGALAAGGCVLTVLIFYITRQMQVNPPQTSAWIAAFLLLVPLATGLPVLIAAIARRLQDIGLPGRYWFGGLILLPLLLVWPGQKKNNAYGPPVANRSTEKRG